MSQQRKTEIAFNTMSNAECSSVSLRAWLGCAQKPYYEDESVALYHADNRDVLPLLRKTAVNMILTDPPYGIEYISNHRQQKFEGMIGDENYPSEWIREIELAENSSIYLFCEEASIEEAKQAMKKAGFPVSRLLVWDKGAMAGGDLSNYGGRTEYIIFGKKKYARLNGSRDSNLISIPRVHPTKLVHPAEKPIDLMSYLIMKSTEYNEIIIDPFAGSGKSLLAAKRLRRLAIGIEIEERNCEIAAHLLQREMIS
jgi:site-specific DNA-methyltransferase (adenine-specific)